MGESLLRINNLHVQFQLPQRIISAVNGLSLCIGVNETVVLAGESGSGKTITALSVTRNLPVSARIISGEIFFQGQDIMGLDPLELTLIRGKRIAYIFQEPAAYLNPVFTIGAQIEEAVVLHQKVNKQEARIRTIELLGLVKMKDPTRVSFAYPHQLSGGMNQRAMIAMALACKPELLIADEPTTSLDVTIESQILQLMGELKKTLGFSMLFITHNLSIARKIADRIYIIYRGKIVEEGNREDIFTAPQHLHTRELMRAYEKIGKI